MRSLSVLCILSTLVIAAPALAEDTAKDLYERASAQYALGKYNDAAVSFERAFELKPDPAILYNAAQAHRLAGNKQRSLDLYISYLRQYGDSTNSRAEVQRHIDNLRAALAKDRATTDAPPMTLKTQTQATTPPNGRPITTAKVTPPSKAKPEPVVVIPPPPKPEPVVVVTPPPSIDTAITAPPPEKPKHKVKPWVWGVVAGGIVVVGAVVVVGVLVGTRGSKDPDPTFGKATGN